MGSTGRRHIYCGIRKLVMNELLEIRECCANIEEASSPVKPFSQAEGEKIHYARASYLTLIFRLECLRNVSDGDGGV